MTYTCTIHTDYIDTSKREEILRNVTKIITEALLSKEKEERYEEHN